MIFNEILNDLISILKEDRYFDHIKVICAYPYSEVPTRAKECCVAIGFDEVKMTSLQLESGERMGDVSVFADIFVPIKDDSRKTCDIFSRICKCFSVFNVVSIFSKRIEVDKNTQTYVLKTKITFNDEIVFGGGKYE